MKSLSLDISHVFAWNVCGLSLSILRCNLCLTNRFYLGNTQEAYGLSRSAVSSKRTKLKGQLLSCKSFSTQYHPFSELRSFRLRVVSFAAARAGVTQRFRHGERCVTPARSLRRLRRRLAYESFLLSVRLRSLESIRLRPICQLAYILNRPYYDKH